MVPGGRIMRMIDSAMVVLPEPDSPTMPIFLPEFQDHVYTVNSFYGAGFDIEICLQIL